MTAKRFLYNVLRLLPVLLLVAVGIHPSRAGNPIWIHSVGGLVTWENGVVPFSTDLGPLGILDDATATQMVQDGFVTWAATPTAAVFPDDQGPIILGAVPVDVTIANYLDIVFALDGQSPVIFDHTGEIMAALGVGQFSGVSFNEFLTPDFQQFAERLIILNGLDVDGNGPFDAISWPGLVNHEIGHHLGLAHSVVNGQAFFFGQPILGFGFPPADSLETMYPFLQIDNAFQASPHKDDQSMLSLLYPNPFFSMTGSIRGNIIDGDLVSPLRGVNVTARNAALPFHDAVSNISSRFDWFLDVFTPPTGIYSLDGLTAGEDYSVAINEIRGVGSGFNPEPLSPLPGPEEFYNGASESNDPDKDVPTDLVLINAPSGIPMEGIDIFINSAASARILNDPNAAEPPADAAVSGFDVPPEIDIRRVDARFEDTDGDGGLETLVANLIVVGPLGARNSTFRFELDFGEPRRVRREMLSLKDQTAEPGTRGFPTADVTLELSFTRAGPVFTGLPSLANNSSVDLGTGTVQFVASVEEIFSSATQEQIDAANNFDGTFTILGFASAQSKNKTDRVPDTDDNDDPSIVQETSQFTFFPFPIVPTHLASVPNGNLIAVDETTARALVIGKIGIGSFSDLALSAEGRLFGSTGFGQTGRIVHMDPVMVAFWGVIGLSGFDGVPALDFGPPGTAFEGILYGIGRNFTDVTPEGVIDFLITIDTATGLGTPVGGSTVVPFLDCIVFTDDGRMFGTGFAGGESVLVEVDPSTGVAQTIGPIGHTVVGLEVASDGSLLGSTGGIDSQPGSIVRIDPVTGSGTRIGPTGFAPVSGLTKLP